MAHSFATDWGRSYCAGTWGCVFAFLGSIGPAGTLLVVLAVVLAIMFRKRFSALSSARRVETLDALESRLAAEYVPVFRLMGLSLEEAEAAFAGVLNKATEILSESDWAWLDAKAYLTVAATKPEVAADLRWKRSEGVTDSDIAWWWNLPSLEKCVLIFVHTHFTLYTAYSAMRRSGVTPDVANREVRKFHPVYCVTLPPDDEPLTDDSCLPIELWRRVLEWSERRRKKDPEAYAEELRRCSSFNALIRGAFRAQRRPSVRSNPAPHATTKGIPLSPGILDAMLLISRAGAIITILLVGLIVVPYVLWRLCTTTPEAPHAYAERSAPRAQEPKRIVPPSRVPSRARALSAPAPSAPLPERTLPRWPAAPGPAPQPATPRFPRPMVLRPWKPEKLTAGSAFAAACEAAERGNHAVAELEYARAIDKSPGYAPAYYNRAGSLIKLGRDGDALRDYSTAIELMPNAHRCYHNRAVVLLLQGLPDAALADLKKAIALMDDHYLASMEQDYATALYNRGLAHAAVHRYRDAESDFEHALARDPTLDCAREALRAVHTRRQEPLLY